MLLQERAIASTEDSYIARWRMLVACVLRQATFADRAELVWEEFIEDYESPKDLLCMSELQKESLKELIRPLGMNRLRLQRLIDMSIDYHANSLIFQPDDMPIENMAGCSNYAVECWNVFALGNLDYPVTYQDLCELING